MDSFDFVLGKNLRIESVCATIDPEKKKNAIAITAIADRTFEFVISDLGGLMLNEEGLAGKRSGCRVS